MDVKRHVYLLSTLLVCGRASSRWHSLELTHRAVPQLVALLLLRGVVRVSDDSNNNLREQRWIFVVVLSRLPRGHIS